MSLMPEERHTAREYDRWLGGPSLSGRLMRLLTHVAGVAVTYLVNTPVLGLTEQLNLQPQHRVLDLACGSGGVAASLAGHAGLTRDPIGVDASTVMLRLAMRDPGVGRRVDLVAAGATRLPFANESFDLLVAAYLFKYLEDQTLFRVLLEAQRVLKPGGILLGWEFAPTSSRRLNRLHRWLLTRRVKTFHLRGFEALAPYALYAGYEYVDRLQLRLPFLFPPIPRVVVMLQKGRHGRPTPVDETAAQELWESREGGP